MTCLPYVLLLAAAGAAPSNDAEVISRINGFNVRIEQASDLARQRSPSSQLRALASDIAAMQARSQSVVASIAKRKNVRLVAHPNSEQLSDVRAYWGALTRLRSMSGRDFDRAYLNLILEEHNQLLHLAQIERGKTADPSIRELLTQMIPQLKKNRDRALALSGRGAGTAS